MKISSYNDILSLIANIGVIVGIVFLAIEIQQNTNIARANAYQQLTQDIGTVREWLVLDPELDEIYRKYQRGQSNELEDREAERISTVIRAMFGAYDNAYYFYKLGVISDSEWRRFFVGACSHMRNIGSDTRLQRIPASLDFGNFINNAFQSNECIFPGANRSDGDT